MNGRSIACKAGGSVTVTWANVNDEKHVSVTVVDERGERKAALANLTTSEAVELLDLLSGVLAHVAGPVLEQEFENLKSGCQPVAEEVEVEPGPAEESAPTADESPVVHERVLREG